MAKASLKSEILCKGFQVFLEKGYTGASVRDISVAAGVSLGTFTGHFASKEAFAIEALNLYYSALQPRIAATLGDESVTPIKRIKAFLDNKCDETSQCSSSDLGCHISGFGVEASKHSEAIRLRVSEIFSEIEEALTVCLKAAVKSGDLAKNTDCKALSGFIYGSLQGAYLQSQIEKNEVPVKRFRKLLFSNILQT
ncbi:MAG: TetR/AcrR family transcriptional regulator [Proteobacteria bacterium]|nr:MAG: TetR/AcrR family transcriptional regulator [Pseudomonadota bacterium]